MAVEALGTAQHIMDKDQSMRRRTVPVGETFHVLDYRSKVLQLAEHMHYSLCSLMLDIADIVLPLVADGGHTAHEAVTYAMTLRPVDNPIHAEAIQKDILSAISAGYGLQSDIREFSPAAMPTYIYRCEDCCQSFKPAQPTNPLPESVLCPLCRRKVIDRELGSRLQEEYRLYVKNVQNSSLLPERYKWACRCLGLFERIVSTPQHFPWKTGQEEVAVLMEVAPKIFDYETLDRLKTLQTTEWLPKTSGNTLQKLYAQSEVLKPLYESLSTTEETTQSQFCTHLTTSCPGILPAGILDVWDAFGMIKRNLRRKKEVTLHRVYRREGLVKN